MKKFQIYWSETIINNRAACIISVLLLLSFSIISLIKFPSKYDNSFEMFMLKGDPNIVKFEKFRDLFGDAEYLNIGITARGTDPDVFVAKTIKIINDISTMLEDHEYVTKVSSLSNYQFTHNLNGIMTTDDLFDNPSSLNRNSLELALARDIMLNESLAHDRLITKDLQHTRILVRTEYVRNENAHKEKVSNDIYNFLNEKNYISDGYQIRLGGGAIISERFEYLSKRDATLLNPIVAVIMSLIIYVLYGSVLICFLPWVLIAASIALVSGIQAWLQFPNTVVNAALIPTLIIIGMGVSVHVLSEFFQLSSTKNCPINAAKETTKNLLKPVFFTALTTAIGFGALAVTELVPVKQYALMAAVGSLAIFFISMTLFVSILSYVTIVTNNKKPMNIDSLIIFVTKMLANFTKRNKIVISFISSCAVLFCVITVPRISVDSNIFNYFQSHSWINQDMEYFDKLYKFSGVELIVDSGTADGIKDPKFLKRVSSLETHLNGLEKTGKANSVVEFLKKLRQAVHNDDPEFFILPDSSEMTAQLLFMYESSGPNDDLSDSIDFDKRFLRISLPVENSSAKEFANFYNFLQNDLSLNFPDLEIEYTGPMVLYNAQEIYINSGLKKSFALALVMIGASFIVLFRSFKYGVIALFPSVLPILIGGGVTIFMGISLDLGTIIVGAMCMGIAVDDAIHVMARYINYKSAGLKTHDSIDLALQESGKAVIFTSLILIFGFSAMLFASLVPTVLFGVFTALIMTLALLGDLFVLPALIFIFERD
ncbi:MAG: MMPL family transporter [Paracoccaceae bacterium]|nr:MMPL family transporter [Paracoccaceae bacterium]